MTIDGLTKEQVDLLDKMWSIESLDDFEVWLRSLPQSKVLQVMTLRELMILADIDEGIDEMSSYPDAAQMLKKIGV